MTAHGVSLMSNDAHIRARFAGAQQHVAGFAVGRKVRIGIGLIHRAWTVETTGAGEAFASAMMMTCAPVKYASYSPRHFPAPPGFVVATAPACSRA